MARRPPTHPGQCQPSAHLHHGLQALGGHVPLKEACQQILKGVQGVQVQGLEREGGGPAPLVTPLPLAAFPLAPTDAGR